MSIDYEQFYQEFPNGLGEPTKVFVDFFGSFDNQNASVLDVGCGQGRDALFIARIGHRVTAVDLSPTGIKQLLADAKAENLKIKTVVTDICEYTSDQKYDVILIDRTLHMLRKEDQIQVLGRLLEYVLEDGFVLIADEKSNMLHLKQVFEDSDQEWSICLEKGGSLFLQSV